MADDKILERVRALIAKADSTTFPEEADAFRAKAEALMMRYRISEWQLKDPDQASRSIEHRLVNMEWYETNPQGEYLWHMMQGVAKHCRVKLVHWKYSGVSIPVVGTKADMDWFELLFTATMLEMSKGLEPKPSRDETLIANLVRLKEAGQTWERIAHQLWEIDLLPQFDEPPTKKEVHMLNFSGKYTKFCKDHDRERLRVTPSVYQRSFAIGFTATVRDRLQRMTTEGRAVYDSNTEAEGTDLVLADIGLAVDAKTTELFGLPGRGSRGRRDTRKVDSGARMTGAERAREVDLGNRAIGNTAKEIGA